MTIFPNNICQTLQDFFGRQIADINIRKNVKDFFGGQPTHSDQRKVTALDFLFAFVFFVIALPSYGWVFAKLWYWFVVPTFGLQALTIVQATGIMFTLLYVKYRAPQKQNEERDWKTVIRGTIVHLSLTLLVGYIIHLFM